MTESPNWVRGDLLGLEMPAHAGALREGGPDWLTLAFRATGALAADNRVTAITHMEPCEGGSTGRKLLLSVTYQQPSPELSNDLFVKFSRDLDDSLRDRGRYQMAREVRLALLSRAPAFPITVATCHAADFHESTGTGVLITRRVPFGRDGIEPHREKCLDYRLSEPLPHYQALVRALARLAGTHRAGRLPKSVEQAFPFDPDALAVSRRESYGPEQVLRRIQRYAEFATNCPQLLPPHLRSSAFIAQLTAEAPALVSARTAVQDLLAEKPEYVALCHWNANIDNAWFWRDADGTLECGLMDWGNVSQMPVAMALWGCLSGAETDLWDKHLETLLALFAQEFHNAGGPALDPSLLQRQLLLHARVMGLNWLLDVPALLHQMVPDLADVPDRYDPRISDNEAARSQLQMLTVFLNLWATRDPGPLPAQG